MSPAILMLFSFLTQPAEPNVDQDSIDHSADLQARVEELVSTPIFDFPVSRSLGIDVSKIGEPSERVFSSYIAWRR